MSEREREVVRGEQWRSREGGDEGESKSESEKGA